VGGGWVFLFWGLAPVGRRGGGFGGLGCLGVTLGSLAGGVFLLVGGVWGALAWGGVVGARVGFSLVDNHSLPPLFTVLSFPDTLSSSRPSADECG